MADSAFVGLTTIEGIVSGPRGRRPITFLIDTGAQYSLLPHDVWTSLGLRAVRSMTFQLADMSRTDRAISECLIELRRSKGRHRTTTRP